MGRFQVHVHLNGTLTASTSRSPLNDQLQLHNPDLRIGKTAHVTVEIP